MTNATDPQPAPARDPAELIRSRAFVGVLVLSAVVGVIVSAALWGFLELVHQIQVGVFTDLPPDLGFHTVPWWWPLPILTAAGPIVAFAIVRLPGEGGHVPANGLQVGTIEPGMIPGVALAALATLGLGLVLGPEAPRIALGGGIAIFTVRRLKRDAPNQALLILGAAGGFAGISVIFSSPLIAAILVIEASGLGGAMLPLIVIPGLIAAGIGSLVFIGISNWTGLSTAAFSLTPLHLTHLARPTFAEIGWAIFLGLAGALLTYPARHLGLRTAKLVPRKPFLAIPAAGLAVAALAVLFAQTTTHGVDQVLFSGQAALPGLVSNAATYSLGALALLGLCKGVGWGLSLGGFRGGPTFPALFLGAAGGLAASHLPGLPVAPAIAVGMGVMVAAFLKLPLSGIVIATLLTTSGGTALVPLIIVGVVVAYLTTLVLEHLGTPDAAGQGTAAATPASTSPRPAATVERTQP